MVFSQLLDETYKLAQLPTSLVLMLLLHVSNAEQWLYRQHVSHWKQTRPKTVTSYHSIGYTIEKKLLDANPFLTYKLQGEPSLDIPGGASRRLWVPPKKQLAGTATSLWECLSYTDSHRNHRVTTLTWILYLFLFKLKRLLSDDQVVPMNPIALCPFSHPERCFSQTPQWPDSTFIEKKGLPSLIRQRSLSAIHGWYSNVAAHIQAAIYYWRPLYQRKFSLYLTELNSSDYTLPTTCI